MNASTVKIIKSTNKTQDILVTWKSPENPNGVIITFQIEYKKISTADVSLTHSICIMSMKARYIMLMPSSSHIIVVKSMFVPLKLSYGNCESCQWCLQAFLLFETILLIGIFTVSCDFLLRGLSCWDNSAVPPQICDMVAMSFYQWYLYPLLYVCINILL